MKDRGMRLNKCNLDITGIIARPLVKTEPEPEWVDAKKKETIPPALYRFYTRLIRQRQK